MEVSEIDSFIAELEAQSAAVREIVNEMHEISQHEIHSARERRLAALRRELEAKETCAAGIV